MGDFVLQRVAAEFVCGITQDKEASLRMNPARPLFQTADRLKLLPIGRALENINVRVRIANRLLALKLLRHHAIMKTPLRAKRSVPRLWPATGPKPPARSRS
jgi:hypothetical protein